MNGFAAASMDRVNMPDIFYKILQQGPIKMIIASMFLPSEKV